MAWILFAVFIVVPLLEILAFIEVGSLIGALPTLGLTVLTAVVGAMIVRRQGLRMIGEARQRLARNELPLDSALHGGFLVLAGLLLLTPGFVTDTVGFLLLVPRLRLIIARRAWTWLKAHAEVRVQKANGAARPGRGPTVIDAEAVEVHSSEPPDRSPREPSPWSSSRGHTR